ncbi:HD-GYP domain-containing protein [Streptomyces sp. E11-3]|uniref:HD-GYP domain-containing protein n=1 Tax=Streptomyces sp. E11-3 TaxID=3110112 RepID=UPI003980D1FC
MRSVPPLARLLIACAVLGAVGSALPAFTHPTPWTTVALLAALYAGCERIGRSRFVGERVPQSIGAFLPVLLAGVFLLPPHAAALIAVPGALIAPAERRPAGPRRLWRAAQLALACWAGATVHRALDGCTALSADAPTVPHFPHALLPAGASALAFCLTLAVLDGGILATAERRPLRTAWRGHLLSSLAPTTVHGLAGLMMAVLWTSPYGPLAALLVLLPMYVSGWIFAQYHRERAAHQATIRALVQAVDIKDEYTRGHSERVGRASELIARELGMTDERVKVLRFAGILHDVGKLGVPTRLLRKDGPLTLEERRVIELHPEYGHEMVRGIGFLGEARSAILHHHERLDGSGYPYGLAGREIPEFARVVAVADAFDAMTSTRSYSRARPVADAVTELKRCAGQQFDPRMVRALVRALDRHGWHPAVTADEPTGPRDTGRNVPPPQRTSPRTSPSPSASPSSSPRPQEQAVRQRHPGPAR